MRSSERRSFPGRIGRISGGRTQKLPLTLHLAASRCSAASLYKFSGKPSGFTMEPFGPLTVELFMVGFFGPSPEGVCLPVPRFSPWKLPAPAQVERASSRWPRTPWTGLRYVASCSRSATRRASPAFPKTASSVREFPNRNASLRFSTSVEVCPCRPCLGPCSYNATAPRSHRIECRDCSRGLEFASVITSTSLRRAGQARLHASGSTGQSNDGWLVPSPFTGW